MIQYRRVIATLLIVSNTSLALPQQAYAEMLSTDAAVAASDRDRIQSVLDRAEAQAQLKAYGVSPADAKARVAALTDEEVAQVARKMDALPAGGDPISAIVGAALIVFIILLITDLLGFTRVFPFVKHGSLAKDLEK